MSQRMLLELGGIEIQISESDGFAKLTVYGPNQSLQNKEVRNGIEVEVRKDYGNDSFFVSYLEGIVRRGKGSVIVDGHGFREHWT